MRLIDADALCMHLSDWQFGLMTDGKHDAEYEVINKVIDGIEKEPTVSPDMAQVLAYECGKAERKRGEWIEENRRPRSMMFYCSECHRTAYDPQNHHGGQKRCRYAFCPNCGADMRGEQG